MSGKTIQLGPSCSMQTDGQLIQRRADMTKPIAAFRYFAKTPEKKLYLLRFAGPEAKPELSDKEERPLRTRLRS